jgi:transposase
MAGGYPEVMIAFRHDAGNGHDGAVTMRAVAVKGTLSADDLRRLAAQEKVGAVSRRMLALAAALDGMPRAMVARLFGMDRQLLPDWIARYNAEGLAGLADRPIPGRKAFLSAEQRDALYHHVVAGPGGADGISEFRVHHLVEWTDREFGIRYSPEGMRQILHQLNLRPLSCRPQHPKADPALQADFRQTFAARLAEIAAAHPGQTIEVWFQDETRVGQKGMKTRRWALKGSRPRVTRDNGRKSAWIFGAFCPERDTGVALVLPKANAAAMNLHLQEISKAVTAGAHAALIMDGAGWHGAAELVIPDNITVVTLPPYSPELNAAERVWEFMKENILAHQVYRDMAHIIDRCCNAWNRVVAEVGRIRNLCSYAWAMC